MSRAERQKLATAFHEAGHAICAWKFNLKIRKISIRADVDSHGRVAHESPLRGVRLDINGSDRAAIKAERAIIICLAGPIAQRRHRPSSYRTWHAAGDHDAAGDLALRLQGSGALATAYLKWLDVATDAVVDANWQHISKLAHALIAHEEMKMEQVQALLVKRGGVIRVSEADPDDGAFFV